MSFLSPWWIALAAGLTIPPLVALYFLKLKRVKHRVASTLLWKRTVQDFHVNSPFQRLRRNLLLLLQLLVLILGAIALGRPMFQTVKTHDNTVIIMVDQSASMGVVESGGRSRLELAKQQAKRCVDNMGTKARAMVIAFSDRATMISSFDTDKNALKRKIDSIEQTQSTSTLGEAMSLAEAYTQNMIIGGTQQGADIAPERTDVMLRVARASVFLFTDGRIRDADRTALQKFEVTDMTVTNVGLRDDNVGIVAMDARRHYEQPDLLEVTATVQNFGAKAVTVDAVLYVDGENRQITTFDLAPASDPDAPASAESADAPSFDVRVVPFVETFAGGGMIEVALRIDDALEADNHAYTIADEPRHMKVLLVTPGNIFLENVLETLPLEYETMTGAAYETAGDDEIVDGERSAYDVVIFDGHSTGRLAQGNYLFWAAVPRIPGVSVGARIKDEIIFNWDDTHPVLRYVAPSTLDVFEWLRLDLPPEAVSIIDGETSSVLSHLTRDASQFLICAFKLIVEDDSGGLFMNTTWATQVDFVVFMQNALQFLSSNVAAIGRSSVTVGEPVTLPIARGADRVSVIRPDNSIDEVPSAGFQNIHYARTRDVGHYRIEPGVPGADAFVVNLFDPVESCVAPADTLTIGAASLQTQSSTVQVNDPAWRYFLVALLVFLVLEWIVYNKRIFV